MLEQLLLSMAAGLLTNASMGGVFSQATVDGQLSDPVIKTRNAAVWEVYRVFYHALAQSLADKASWPAPTGDTASGLLGLAAQVVNLLKAIPGLNLPAVLPGVLKP